MQSILWPLVRTQTLLSVINQKMRISRARCQNPLGRAAQVSQEVIEHTASAAILSASLYRYTHKHRVYVCAVWSWLCVWMQHNYNNRLVSGYVEQTARAIHA